MKIMNNEQTIINTVRAEECAADKMREYIERTASTRSAWDRGVKEYAIDMMDDLAENYNIECIDNLESALLNGADNWEEYSAGGCALIYNADIAARLCTPTELTKTNHGKRNPNKKETWIDVQARALYQAFRLVRKAFDCLSYGKPNK